MVRADKNCLKKRKVAIHNGVVIPTLAVEHSTSKERLK